MIDEWVDGKEMMMNINLILAINALPVFVVKKIQDSRAIRPIMSSHTRTLPTSTPLLIMKNCPKKEPCFGANPMARK